MKSFGLNVTLKHVHHTHTHTHTDREKLGSFGKDMEMNPSDSISMLCHSS